MLSNDMLTEIGVVSTCVNCLQSGGRRKRKREKKAAVIVVHVHLSYVDLMPSRSPVHWLALATFLSSLLIFTTWIVPRSKWDNVV